MSLTRDIGRFVADLSPNQVPKQAAEAARVGFIDCVGTMIAGRKEPAPRILRQVLNQTGGSATLYFSGDPSPAPEAAWINGAAAHALDYDDVALRGHPSAVLVPAILAEAETLDVSGAFMVAAYVAGYETWAELIRRERGFHHGKGWHPTGIFGAVAAAAACALLRRLDPEQTAQALALGATQSAGLMANFGTMTKPFHAGRSAQSGLMAARLVESGFTASSDALEHSQGFLNAISPEGHVDRAEPPSGLGRTWALVSEGLSVKKYPTCYCTHRAIDGMLDLVSKAGVQAADVKKIGVSLSENYATILRNHRPQTGLAAKFSIEFALSSAVIARRVGLNELTDSFVQRDDVQAMIQTVSVETNTRYDPESPGASLYDQVWLEVESGEIVEGEKVHRARGHATRPLTESELFGKFENCLVVGESEVSAVDLFARLKDLERFTGRELTRVH